MKTEASFQKILEQKMAEKDSPSPAPTGHFQPPEQGSNVIPPLWLKLENLNPIRVRPSHRYPPSQAKKKATLPPKKSPKPPPQEPSWPLETLSESCRKDLFCLLEIGSEVDKTALAPWLKQGAISISVNDVKRLYRRLALYLHPDSAGAKASSEKFRLSTEAYQRILKELSSLKKTAFDSECA